MTQSSRFSIVAACLLITSAFIGGCNSGVFIGAEPKPPRSDEPTVATTRSDDLPQDWSITLPSRKEEPWAGQWDRQTAATLDVHPARYERLDAPILTIPLSVSGLENPDANKEDPRFWNRRYRDVTTEGFSVLDPVMEKAVAMGFREVWFWGFSGMHERRDSLSYEVMPWFHLDAHTPVMIESWPDFVAKWKARGMRFGLWLGGIAAPNFGTTLEPKHRWITRADFDFVGDTIARADDAGFDAVGLDAFSWILAKRDRPEWAKWKMTNHTGQRQPGIAMDLLKYLHQRRDTRDVRLYTETRAPYGPFLAETPTWFLMSSRNNPKPGKPTVEQLEPPTIENAVNPGHEIVGMISINGWTLDEYREARRKLDAWGYRTAVNINVLYEVGLMP